MSTKKGEEKVQPEVEQQIDTPINLREKFIKEQLSRRTKLAFWLYAGMAVLLIAIVFFWGFSLWSTLTTFNWKKTQESKLIDSSQTDLNKIFQTVKQTELQKQITKIQLKDSLRKVLQNIPATSTTSTIDTISTSTTSTLITTSTIVTTTKK